MRRQQNLQFTKRGGPLRTQQMNARLCSWTALCLRGEGAVAFPTFPGASTAGSVGMAGGKVGRKEEEEGGEKGRREG